MPIPKILKFAAVAFLTACFGLAITYTQLPRRHKAIVKTQFLHRSGLLENDWKADEQEGSYSMISPVFWIDGIYTSMEGPKALNYVRLSDKPGIVFLKSFSVRAMDAETGKPISNDFICHTNVDFNDARYFGYFGLNDRIGKQYPRMTSLSHGQENFAFPFGYGVPMPADDWLFVTTQTLNHNRPDIDMKVRHRVDMRFTENKLRPLMSRTAFIRLPYDKRNPYKEPTDPGANQCIPVETKNHSYDDGKGNMLSGHWVIPPGRKLYRSDVSDQLQIKDSLRLHAAAIHVHPFAEWIELRDKTTGKTVFRSEIENHAARTGLKRVASFSSEDGIWLFAKDQYEIVLGTNNTTSVDQDMMGSMFLFFYDAELDARLTQTASR